MPKIFVGIYFFLFFSIKVIDKYTKKDYLKINKAKQSNTRSKTMSFRITITDHSTGVSYSPRVQTIINRLGKKGVITSVDPWIVHTYEVTARNWTNYVGISDIADVAAIHWYGETSRFFRNHELADQGIYGQFVRPCRTGGLDCVTPQIKLTITVNGHKVNTQKELYNALRGE